MYVAKNEAGYVFVAGETFVGVKADGTVVTEGIDDAAPFTNAVATLKKSTLKDSLTEVQKTLASTGKLTRRIIFGLIIVVALTNYLLLSLTERMQIIQNFLK